MLFDVARFHVGRYAVLVVVHADRLTDIGGTFGVALRRHRRRRVVLKITPERVASWDHQKLGGAY